MPRVYQFSAHAASVCCVAMTMAVVGPIAGAPNACAACLPVVPPAADGMVQRDAASGAEPSITCRPKRCPGEHRSDRPRWRRAPGTRRDARDLPQRTRRRHGADMAQRLSDGWRARRPTTATLQAASRHPRFALKNRHFLCPAEQPRSPLCAILCVFGRA
jgi:hypothetical protein